MKLSPATKSFLGKTIDVSTFAIQWGFVPFVVYLGFKKGAEPMPNGQRKRNKIKPLLPSMWLSNANKSSKMTEICANVAHHIELER
ncbi:hypothetical protein GCK72_009108 [Caenorhabditis remanei]|uniref:Mitochondrial import receptor subunit TOM7 homolog n=1 Tax=Caenorhabditis remanei TaxID=31234 RepID=A0A6A5H0R6_CAERE|nr:hypothetical protein GCK72_009108 [Caenorhabditis remanei]KAF1760857.1 hypothetical protein GCK72_009108 [Caenorhabditis remanei]